MGVNPNTIKVGDKIFVDHIFETFDYQDPYVVTAIFGSSKNPTFDTVGRNGLKMSWYGTRVIRVELDEDWDKLLWE